jgi:hypothetical protein
MEGPFQRSSPGIEQDVSEFTLEKLLDAIKESPPPEWKRPVFIAPNEAFAEAARKEFGESAEVSLQERIYSLPQKRS